MPTLNQILRQYKRAGTPIAQTPIPSGYNPSAFAYQQSQRNAAAQLAQLNASQARYEQLMRDAAAKSGPYVPPPGWMPDPDNPGGYMSPETYAMSVIAAGQKQNEDFVAQNSVSYIDPTTGKTVSRYDPGQAANLRTPQGGHMITTADPSPAPLIGGIGEPGQPFVPVGGNLGAPYAPPPVPGLTYAGGPLEQGSPSVPTSPTPTPTPAPAPYVTPQSRRETDPLGSLYDAFQRSLKQATLPASFSTTWGG